MSRLPDVGPDTGIGMPRPDVQPPDAPDALAVGRPRQRHVGRGIALGVMVVLLVLPFVPLIFWSVSRRWIFPQLIPAELSERAWSYVFSDRSEVIAGLATSLIIATAVAVIAASIGLSGGRALGL